MKIKKGDKVVVVVGKDKGKEGEVLKVFTDLEKVLVSGVNIAIKHVKKTQEKAGERIEKELPLHVSNVMILDNQGKPSRIQYSFQGKKKIRRFSTTKEVVTENFTKA